MATFSAGGATSGYCDTGNLVSAKAPAINTDKAMTQAKMGRVIKNCGSMVICLQLVHSLADCRQVQP